MHNEPSLEVVQLELLLDLADLIAQGFEAALLSVLDDVDGQILFNHRLDGDPQYQRVAAVMVGADADVALVFLDRSGTTTHVEGAAESDRAIAREAEKARNRALAAQA
ncbi:hypothetical protein R2G56_11590 [Nitratireductor aquimarinus]|uniref:Uncharacterized protein n=1 Tax=Nitratireductor aquimarinus TaxID=889300 RepID=A0ABU4AL08_9HYPH|nr:hypothetical protein [Nitratireductor aquimarinus]MDV6226930.1 hypothetical protein [Nitratireductor aquimarinus]